MSEKKEEQLTFLLMGKTGHGKSATGNTLLNRRVFTTSASTTSYTQEVDSSSAYFKNNILLVVDGPGLEDTQLDTVKDKERAEKNMDKAIVQCYGGVNAFLFNFKFGTRFTAEEQSALNSLKRIFGDDYMKFVIVVVTCGDQFQRAMEEEQWGLTFEEWCKKQTGPFRQLYEDCKGRFVLFDNISKDEQQRESQIQHLVDLTRDLKTKYGTYTSESFQKAEYERKKHMVELREPAMALEIQQGISLLTAEIDTYSKQPSEFQKQQILKRIQNLKDDITIQDQGYNLMSHLKDTVNRVEQHLRDVDVVHSQATQLDSLAGELEEERARAKKSFWDVLGPICAIVGVLVAPLAPLVGAGIVGVGAGIVGAGSAISASKK